MIIYIIVLTFLGVLSYNTHELNNLLKQKQITIDKSLKSIMIYIATIGFVRVITDSESCKQILSDDIDFTKSRLIEIFVGSIDDDSGVVAMLDGLKEEDFRKWVSFNVFHKFKCDQLKIKDIITKRLEELIMKQRVVTYISIILMVKEIVDLVLYSESIHKSVVYDLLIYHEKPQTNLKEIIMGTIIYSVLGVRTGLLKSINEASVRIINILINKKPLGKLIDINSKFEKINYTLTIYAAVFNVAPVIMSLIHNHGEINKAMTDSPIASTLRENHGRLYIMKPLILGFGYGNRKCPGEGISNLLLHTASTYIKSLSYNVPINWISTSNKWWEFPILIEE